MSDNWKGDVYGNAGNRPVGTAPPHPKIPTKMARWQKTDQRILPIGQDFRPSQGPHHQTGTYELGAVAFAESAAADRTVLEAAEEGTPHVAWETIPCPGLGSACRELVQDKAGEPVKQLTIELPARLHVQVKAECALHGLKMKDLVRALLERECATTLESRT